MRYRLGVVVMGWLSERIKAWRQSGGITYFVADDDIDNIKMLDPATDEVEIKRMLEPGRGIYYLYLLRPEDLDSLRNGKVLSIYVASEYKVMLAVQDETP